MWLTLTLQFFANEESLMAHRHIYHDGASASKSSNDKAYECDVCMKVFNKHSSWWKHKKCHTGKYFLNTHTRGEAHGGVRSMTHKAESSGVTSRS